MSNIVGDPSSSDMTRWESNFQRMVSLGDELAEAKMHYENLKNVKATVIAQAKAASKEKTESGKTRDAEMSKEYIQWCEDYRKAVYEYEYVRLRYTAAKTWFDLVRTAEATRREEMRLT